MSIHGQCGRSDLGARILAALEVAGKDLDAITGDNLTVFDQIQMRGREATIELVELAGLRLDLPVRCRADGQVRPSNAQYA